MNHFCGLLLILVITIADGAKDNETSLLPWCQLGGKEDQPVAPYEKNLGNTLMIFCPFSHYCDGQCTIDHYNNRSGRYDEVTRGACRTTMTITNFDIGGVYKCGCADETANVTQCIHAVNVLPSTIEKDFPTTAIVGESYTGMCRATGNPRPKLDLVLSGICSHSIHHTSPNPYTAQAVITIPKVMNKCRVIYCATSSKHDPLLESVSLNITVRNTTHVQLEMDGQPTNMTDVDGSAASCLTFSVNILLLLSSVALVLT